MNLLFDLEISLSFHRKSRDPLICHDAAKFLSNNLKSLRIVNYFREYVHKKFITFAGAFLDPMAHFCYHINKKTIAKEVS